MTRPLAKLLALLAVDSACAADAKALVIMLLS